MLSYKKDNRGLVTGDDARLSCDALVAKGPTEIWGNRTRILVGNYSRKVAHIRRGAYMARFALGRKEAYLSVTIADGDKGYRAELQEALDAASRNRERAEDELVPHVLRPTGGW